MSVRGDSCIGPVGFGRVLYHLVYSCKHSFILLGTEVHTWDVLDWWFGGSVVFSWIVFVLFQTYKSTIRHAPLHKWQD